MNTRTVDTPEEIVDAVKRGAKVELNTGIYWRRSVIHDPAYWRDILAEHEVRVTENAPVKERTMSWGWIVFWIALFSYVSYSSGVQLARKNIKADTAHIRDVCFNLYRDDNRCIENALKRIEESTP